MSTMQHFSQTFGTLSDTNGVFPFHLLMLEKVVYYVDLGIEVGIVKIIRYKVSPMIKKASIAPFINVNYAAF